MKATLSKTWALFTFAALCSCASLSEQVVWWSRESEIEAAQARSQDLGLSVDDEAYRASLKRWPYISEAGLQRRALIYSLLKAQAKGLESWQTLTESEDPSLELAQIADLRRSRNAF